MKTPIPIPERVWRVAMSAERFMRMAEIWRGGEKPPDVLLRTEARLLARRAALLWIRLKWRQLFNAKGD